MIKANCLQIPMKTERLNDTAKMPTSGGVESGDVFFCTSHPIIYSPLSPKIHAQLPFKQNSCPPFISSQVALSLLAVTDSHSDKKHLLWIVVDLEDMCKMQLWTINSWVFGKLESRYRLLPFLSFSVHFLLVCYLVSIFCYLFTYCYIC